MRRARESTERVSDPTAQTEGTAEDPFSRSRSSRDEGNAPREWKRRAKRDECREARGERRDARCERRERRGSAEGPTSASTPGTLVYPSAGAPQLATAGAASAPPPLAAAGCGAGSCSERIEPAPPNRCARSDRIGSVRFHTDASPRWRARPCARRRFRGGGRAARSTRPPPAPRRSPHVTVVGEWHATTARRRLRRYRWPGTGERPGTPLPPRGRRL